MDPFNYSIGSLPSTTKLREIQSPDCVPSFSRHDIWWRDNDMFEMFEVKDEHGNTLGAMVVAAKGHPVTGKLEPKQSRVFSKEEIYHAGNAKDDARVQTRDAALRE